MANRSPDGTTPIYDYFGDRLYFSCALAAVADGDTYTVPGFRLIDNAIATPDDAVVVVPTIDGTTLTFKVGAGTPDCRLTVIGQ